MTVSGRLQDKQGQRLMHLIDEYRDLFLCGPKDLGQLNVACHRIDTGNSFPVNMPP